MRVARDKAEQETAFISTPARSIIETSNASAVPPFMAEYSLASPAFGIFQLIQLASRKDALDQPGMLLSTPGAKRNRAAPDLRAIFEMRTQIRGGGSTLCRGVNRRAAASQGETAKFGSRDMVFYGRMQSSLTSFCGLG